MIKHWQDRSTLIYSEEALEKLSNCRVAIFGVGGVGGHALEALARSGIGKFDIIDADVVDETNLNRQLLATRDSIGRKKVEVAKERILSINGEAEVVTHELFYLPESKGILDFSSYDYVLDCIDTVSGKVALIEEAKAAGVPVISAMGCGGKSAPSRLKIADIEKTSVCHLAKVMRLELRKRGIKKVKVVYSDEEVIAKEIKEKAESGERTLRRIGSGPFVPCAAGLLMASEVVRELVSE